MKALVGDLLHPPLNRAKRNHRCARESIGVQGNGKPSSSRKPTVFRDFGEIRTERTFAETSEKSFLAALADSLARFHRGGQNQGMTDFLDPGVLNDTLQATHKWRRLFSDLGSFANDMTLSHDPSAFGGEGGDILTMTVEGVEIEAAEWASSDIRFSATFPNGSSIYVGETVFEETDGRSGLFGLKRVSEPVVAARSALNALLVLATMKAIADAVAHRTWDEIRQMGGIDTPIGNLSDFDQG